MIKFYEVDELIKTSMSTLVRMELFWNNFNQVRSIQNICKLNNFKSLWEQENQRD